VIPIRHMIFHITNRMIGDKPMKTLGWVEGFEPSATGTTIQSRNRDIVFRAVPLSCGPLRAAFRKQYSTKHSTALLSRCAA
jgi:hypothetical protein